MCSIPENSAHRSGMLSVDSHDVRFRLGVGREVESGKSGCATEMQFTHLRHGCDEMINRFGDTSTGLVGWTFPTGPDIRRMIDLKHILTKLGEGPLPKHSVAALI